MFAKKLKAFQIGTKNRAAGVANIYETPVANSY
jgi:hypothetical protein